MPYRLIKSMDGRRGGFLFLAGIVYMLIGIVNVVSIPSHRMDLIFAWLPNHVSAKSLGWVWILAALVMLAGGLLSAAHSKLESAGYVVSLLPPFVWGFIFAGSALFGNPYALRDGLVYLFMALSMYYTAGWPNSIVVRGVAVDVPTTAA